MNKSFKDRRIPFELPLSWPFDRRNQDWSDNVSVDRRKGYADRRQELVDHIFVSPKLQLGNPLAESRYFERLQKFIRLTQFKLQHYRAHY